MFRRRGGPGRSATRLALLVGALAALLLLSAVYIPQREARPKVLPSSALRPVPPLEARTLESSTPGSSTSRQSLDEDPIHIAHSFCIYDGLKKTDPGLTVLRSILAARAAGASHNRRYVIHILADEYAAWLLSNNRSAKMPWGKHLESPGSLNLFHEQWGDVIAHIDNSDGRVELQIHPEDDAYAAVEDALGAGATLNFNHDGFKRCSPLRLVLPFLPSLANVSRVLFLDLDVVVLCDAERMWDAFDEWTDDMWLGIAPNSKEDPPSTKEWKEFDGLPASKVYDWQGVNNGVMLWRVDRIRAHLAEYWEEIMRIIKEKAYRSSRFAGFHTKLPDNVMKHPYGMVYYDQDIMNIASYDWPHRFYKLDRKYNWRWKLGRDFQPSAWGAEPGICVEHFSNGDFGVDVGTGRAALFEYWRDYRRVAPGTATRLDRGPGTPKVLWNWATGSGMSLGPKTPRK